MIKATYRFIIIIDKVIFVLNSNSFGFVSLGKDTVEG